MKARAFWIGALLPALSGPLVWPPSTIAQQFALAQRPTTVNLPLTINSAFSDAGLTNPTLRIKLVEGNPAARLEGSSAPMAGGRLEVVHLSPAESEGVQRLPALYQEDTPFSTQVRLAVADLWRGRLQFDGFYCEISADSVFRGLPQSNRVWWTTPGSLSLRPAVSYGIRLSFRMPHIRPRTLYRYLLGRGG